VGKRGTAMTNAALESIRDIVHGAASARATASLSTSTSRVAAATLLPPTTRVEPRRLALLTFLRAVLPEQGPVYFAFTLPAKRHYACRSLDDLSTRLLSLDSDASQQTYFAVAAYAQQRIRDENGQNRQRTAENVAAIRACWLDIDVGQEKAETGTGYASQQEALDAVAVFCAKLCIDPTFTVSSGLGLHVYFTFLAPVAPAQWKPVAKSLKHACVLAGLRADPSRTEDITSVLRPIGCTHRKEPSNPRPIRPLQVRDPIEFAQFSDAVRRIITADHKTAPPALGADSTSDDLQVSVKASAPSIFAGSVDNSDLSAGTVAFRHWLLDLPIEDQYRIIDDACKAIPDTAWSQYEHWRMIIAAFRGLNHLDEHRRLSLLQKHSERSHKWSADGWDQERLRKKYETFTGGSVQRIFDLAEAHGWVRSEASVVAPFSDIATAEDYFVARFIYVADQAAYLDTRTPQLISSVALDDLQFWLTKQLRTTPRALLRGSGKTQRADALGYNPGAGALYKEGRKVLANLYAPWAPEPLQPTSSEIDLWRWFIEGHLFRRPQDDLARDYFLDTLAYPLQNPGGRVASVPTLIGEPYGSGKSTLMERVPLHLFGELNVTVAAQSEIESGFNDWHANAQIVCFPEIWMGASRHAERLANDLKDKITSDRLRVHPKGLKGYSQRNRATLLATSNHEDAVHLREGDRRWGVHVTDAPQLARGDSAALYGFLNSERAPSVLRHIFLSRDLSGFNPQGEPPITHGKRLAIAASVPAILDEMIEAIENSDAPFDRDLVTVERVRMFLGARGYKPQDISPHRIGEFLKAKPISAILLGNKRVNAGISIPGVTIQTDVKRNVWCLRNAASWLNAPESAIAEHLHGCSPAPAPAPAPVPPPVDAAEPIATRNHAPSADALHDAKAEGA
jgi:hypothetical protein